MLYATHRISKFKRWIQIYHQTQKLKYVKLNVSINKKWTEQLFIISRKLSIHTLHKESKYFWCFQFLLFLSFSFYRCKEERNEINAKIKKGNKFYTTITLRHGGAMLPPSWSMLLLVVPTGVVSLGLEVPHDISVVLVKRVVQVHELII